MRHHVFAAVAGALAFTAPAAHAQVPVSPDPAAVRGGAFKLDPNHSKITWSINHFGFSTYVGQFSHVDGAMTLDPTNLGATTLDVTVEAASLGTLNPALDAHIKSPAFLDAAKFPSATFHATKVARTGERTADISGELTLHGVTHPLTVHATFRLGGSNPVDKAYRLGFAGEAKLVRSDYGITAYLPSLGDEVTLTIEAEFRQAPAG